MIFEDPSLSGIYVDENLEICVQVHQLIYYYLITIVILIFSSIPLLPLFPFIQKILKNDSSIKASSFSPAPLPQRKEEGQNLTFFQLNIV